MLLPIISTGQTSEDKFSRPLTDVLNDISKRFEVRLKVPDGLVDGKILRYADWRIRPYSLEQSLINVLAPFDLIFVKEFEKVYKIKPYEYARRTDTEGRLHLDYLSTLYSDVASLEKRRDSLRTEIISTLGIKSLPASPQSKPIRSNFRKMNGYTIQNIALETLPGLYVCASVYKPIKIKGKVPFVLCPNGHFDKGRYNADMQTRCAMLAKMGAIVINYDLFAWGESLLQFNEADHRNSAAQTIQILNGIRLIDYAAQMKEVDTSRIAVTGASGGGSQTMLLSAIDDRIDLIVPVVMTSSYFMGGCPCESGKPIHLCGGGTNNAELASFFAPKPLLIVSDGKDWTQHVPELEYPFIQRIYGFYGAKDQVQNAHFANEGHDYGYSKRVAMYQFIARHFNLDINKFIDKENQFDESSVVVENENAMKVFGIDGKLLPQKAITGLNELIKLMNQK